MLAKFCWKSQKERDYYKDIDIGGKIILENVIEIQCYVMGFTHLAHHGDQ
jgi:hypothetical protein